MRPVLLFCSLIAVTYGQVPIINQPSQAPRGVNFVRRTFGQGGFGNQAAGVVTTPIGGTNFITGARNQGQVNFQGGTSGVGFNDGSGSGVIFGSNSGGSGVVFSGNSDPGVIFNSNSGGSGVVFGGNSDPGVIFGRNSGGSGVVFSGNSDPGVIFNSNSGGSGVVFSGNSDPGVIFGSNSGGSGVVFSGNSDPGVIFNSNSGGSGVVFNSNSDPEVIFGNSGVVFSGNSDPGVIFGNLGDSGMSFNSNPEAEVIFGTRSQDVFMNGGAITSNQSPADITFDPRPDDQGVIINELPTPIGGGNNDFDVNFPDGNLDPIKIKISSAELSVERQPDVTPDPPTSYYSSEASLEKSPPISYYSSEELSLDVSNKKSYFDNYVNRRIITYIKDKSLGEPSVIAGKRVAGCFKFSDINPEELGPYFEGDILYPKKDQNSRNSIVGLDYRWPNGEVPYKISGDFNRAEVQQIRDAMRMIESETCVSFVPYNGKQEDWVSIESGFTGCWSAVGRQGGKQRLNLQKHGCTKKIGTILHQLLHTLGFYHEQSRWERDAFVKIEWDNIISCYKRNFDKYHTDAFGLKYDYDSVMHFSKNAFSKNNKCTIKSKRKIGQRKALSKRDTEKLRAMYNC